MSHIGKCARCGVETEYKFASRVREYCSHACSNAVKAEKRSADAPICSFKCQQCGEGFSMLASEAKARLQVKFCSRKCYGKSRVDPTSPRSIARPKTGRVYSVGPWSKVPDTEARREYFQQYTARNRLRLNEQSRAWAKANRDYRNFIQQQRRAAGNLTYDEWRAIISAANGCAECGADDNLQVDHIVAVAVGGKTEAGNLQVLCRFCNASKGTGLAPKTKRHLMQTVLGVPVRVVK